MSKIDRRRFLKWLGLGGGTLAAGMLLQSKIPLLPEIAKAVPPPGTGSTISSGGGKNFLQSDAAIFSLYTGPAGTISYAYNLDGSIHTLSYGGLTVTYTYNLDGSVHTMTSIVGSTSVTDTYGYASDGSISTVVRT